MEKNGYDIIIIGAGPAGLTAALYTLRANKKVLVLEGKAYGGQIINAKKVENYPGIPSISGAELMKNLRGQVESFGGEMKLEQVIKITLDGNDKIVETDMESSYSAKAVIIATGTGSRKLGLPREKELVGKGVSYCATCDGEFYKGKDVAVVGGGNTALGSAIYLSGIANKVYLVHRRDEFRGDPASVDKIKSQENIECIMGANASGLVGAEKVEGLKVKLSGGDEKTLKVSGVFIAVGSAPQNQDFADMIDLDENGYVKSTDGVHTSARGIYVAGDACAKDVRQLTTAVSDGSIAATTAIKEMDEIR